MQSNLFYDYYDLLFQAKDYTKETDLVFKLSENFGIKNPQKVLEIGCGTGNHTKVLGEYNLNLVSIDIDPEMIRQAKNKIESKQKVKILNNRIEDLAEDNFDLSLAMFNVITYIGTTMELNSFMSAVATRLHKGGIFVFDCWNGIAVIKDPPKSKQSSIEHQGETIDYEVSTQTDFFKQKSLLRYHFKVSNGSKVMTDDFTFEQTLWTPMQITSAIEQSGMELVLCSPLMNPDQKATDQDWKIMFCCKKVA